MSNTSQNGSNQSYGLALTIMVALFFMVGFVTVMNTVLIPSLKGLFDLNDTKAQLVNFAFFFAYFVVSYPTGLIIQKVGYKKGLMVALIVTGVGLLLFVPAAMMVSFGFFLFALFVVGAGMTMLQVAINPYIIACGPEKTGASRLNLAGGLNSFATFVGPIIGATFILKEFIASDYASTELLNQAKADSVMGPYIVLALVTIALGIILWVMHLPKLPVEQPVHDKSGSAFQFLHLKLGSAAIFFYVGTEVAIGSTLILYLATEEMGGINEGLAASLLALYWGSAMIGRFIGSAIGQKIRAEILLRVVALVALLLVVLSMTGFATSVKLMMPAIDTATFGITMVETKIAALFLILVGLFNSVMWPSIFPLGIAKLGKYTSQGSGFMVMMVVGGAVIPVIQGLLIDRIGFKMSFVVSIICYAYILFYAIKGYKMGKIATMKEGETA